MHVKLIQGKETTFCEVDTNNHQTAVNAIKNAVNDNTIEIIILLEPPVEWELTIKK